MKKTMILFSAFVWFSGYAAISDYWHIRYVCNKSGTNYIVTGGIEGENQNDYGIVKPGQEIELAKSPLALHSGIDYKFDSNKRAYARLVPEDTKNYPEISVYFPLNQAGKAQCGMAFYKKYIIQAEYSLQNLPKQTAKQGFCYRVGKDAFLGILIKKDGSPDFYSGDTTTTWLENNKSKGCKELTGD